MKGRLVEENSELRLPEHGEEACVGSAELDARVASVGMKFLRK